jgi:succinate dehydrogenase / fumarate reductase membrane anchor subunit
MKMETPLGRVRGLGPAKAGAHHWWLERLTALGTLVLLVWLAASLLRLPELDHRTLAEWLTAPLAAVPMLLLILGMFWHLKLGLQVVVEDYVHSDGPRLAWIVLINFLSLFGAGLAIFAVLKIALGAGAG